MTNEKSSNFKSIRHQLEYILLTIPLILDHWQDTVLLARLGYKQGVSFPNTNDRIHLHGYIDTLEFCRDFAPLEVFGIGFNIMGLVILGVSQFVILSANKRSA